MNHETAFIPARNETVNRRGREQNVAQAGYLACGRAFPGLTVYSER